MAIGGGIRGGGGGGGDAAAHIPKYVAGQWITPPMAGGTDVEIAFAGDMMMNRIYTPTAISVDSLACRIITAGAATSVIRMGIYRDSTVKGRPDTLVVDGGTVAGNVTGASTSVTFTPVTVGPGWFWLTGVAQGTGTMPTPRNRTQSGEQEIALDAGQALNRTHQLSWNSFGITGALPAGPLVLGAGAGQLDVWVGFSIHVVVRVA